MNRGLYVYNGPARRYDPRRLPCCTYVPPGPENPGWTHSPQCGRTAPRTGPDRLFGLVDSVVDGFAWLWDHPVITVVATILSVWLPVFLAAR